MLKSLASMPVRRSFGAFFPELHNLREATHRAKGPMDLGYGCPLPSQLSISHRQLRQSPARVGGIPWLSLRCKPLALLFLLAVAVSPLQAQDPDPAHPSFVMPAAATALEFELTVTGRGGARYADAGSVTVRDHSAIVHVCERTEQVSDAIVAAVDGVSNCADVTDVHLLRITQLLLADKSIGALQVGDFSGLFPLETLDLSGNSLSALPVGVFADVSGLEVLDLGDNSLSALPVRVFADFFALEVLDLGGNSLSVLRAKVFVDLVALEDLDLGDNSLSVLPAGVFAKLVRLNALHLGGNGLTALPAGVFGGLTLLRSLNLNENLLEELPPAVFNGLGELDALRLHDNRLTALPAGAFSSLTDLGFLSLNDNLLTELPPGIFNGLSALHDLHLYDNRLTALPAGLFSDLRELERLSLNDNLLTALPAGLFSDLRVLMMLFLQDNPGSEDFLPIANAGADQSIGAGHIVTLTATASDADPWGDNIRYAWAQIDNGGGVVTLMNANTARPSFVMPAGATALEFELTVTGLGDARYADTDRVTVRLPAAVVTLSGPVPDPLQEDATAIAGNELILVYSYSADDLRGRVLTGSIEVAASIDGEAITPEIRVAGVRGEITVVLWRQAYPYPGEHELAVALSLSTTAEGFVLGEPSSITTPFSFLPLPPTVLEVMQAEGNQGKRGADGSDAIELGYSFEYAADNRLKRPLAGLSVQVDFELCTDAGYGECSSLPAASMTLTLDDSGSLALRVDRTAAALSVFGEADADSIRHGRVLLSTAGNDDFVATAAATTFSFAVAAAVVTLSGPVHELLPEDATGITGNELSLVYSYSADDLRGRVLTGSIEVAAAIDGVAITPSIEVDEAQGRGEITVVLQRLEYPDSGEHELAVTLSLSTADAGFILAKPSSITTTFSFGALVVADADTVVTLSGPDPMDTTGITGNELSLVYSYSADELYGRVLTGSIEVAAAIDGVAITPSIEVDEAQGRGEITVVLQRQTYPDSGEHELAVTLSLSATAEGFVLGEPSSITTTFSFGALVVADADTVVTLSGPDPMDTTGITGNELSLVYSYSADELYGRVLTGSIEVAAAIDGVAITPSIEVDEAQGRGEITVVLQRQTYPDAGGHELAVTLSLSAAAEGFVLGEPSSITTTFSFGALVVADADTVVTLSGPDPMDTTGITGNELSLVYSYSADELYGRVLTGSIEVAAAIDGVAITPSIEVDEAQGRGEITVVLQRQTYPDSGEHELAVTLSLSATAEGFVLGEPSSITTTFSFGALVVADADTVVTLSGPDPMDTTGITGNELSLVYSYSADELYGRVLTGSIEVAAAIDGVAITPSIEVDEAQGRGEITVVLQRQTYPDAGGHELAVTLSLSAAAEGFVLGEPSSITTTFSFGALVVADADTVVTLSGPDPMDTTGITGNELSLVYSYSADELYGRVLTGSIEVAAAIDGVAITPSIEVDEAQGRGEITVVLQRQTYPDSGEHELAVTLSLSATAEGFVLGEPSSITTTFSFGALVVADAETVVTLSGPDPMDTTGITGNELSLVYSYSADELYGRVLTGSIEVAAAIDGVAITPSIEVDEAQGRGEITVVLQRQTYPDAGGHELAVTLSLSAAAEGFVLGEPSSITTTFSFGALVVADAETVVTLSGPDPMDTTGITGNELSLVYSYSADELYGRVLTGSIEVAAAIDGVAITPSIEVDEAQGRGEITVVLQRQTYPDSGEHELAVTLSLSATAEGFVLGEPSSITTTFSFGALVVADADTVVTLSGPDPMDTTGITGNELSLVYSYSADELYGRVLTGSIEVAAAIDGVAITPSIEVDEAQGRGEITVVLQRQTYPDSGEHELAVTLSLSATAEGFVLGEPSSITTTFSFGALVVADADTVVTLSGPDPMDTTGITGNELSLVYSYSADELYGRVLTGSIEVAAAIDGVAITPSIEVDEAQGRGEITVVLQRQTYPDAGGHELAVTLSLSAAAEGFVLGEPSSITTTFSFGALVVADADTVVTLSGPDPMDTTGITGNELSLVYSYSADELYGRVLTGSIEVAAAIDGVAITPSIEVDEAQGRGEITVVLQRQTYPDAGGHELAVTLSLSAAAEGFVLGEPSSITTTFSFGALVVADADTVVTLSGPDPMDTTGITGNELSLVYSYSADELYGRVLTGSIEVAAAIDGVAITPSIEVDEAQGRGEITVVLQRQTYPDAGGHELAVTLSLSATAEGFVLGEPSSITTTFSFGALVVADADTVVTLSGPDPMDTTGITGNELSLVYSYSADELYGRVLTGSIEVAAAIDGVAITPSIEVDEAQGRGEITVVLQRQTYPDSGEHELAVTLSLSATAEGFVLGEPSSITTTFSFGALVVADADTVVTLSGPDPMDTTGITGNELSLVYSYSADELYGRVLTGSIEVAAAIDGVAITPSIEVDEAQGRGEITVVLQRLEYPDAGGHELAVTLSLSAAAEGFVLGEPSSITTTFSFGALVVADADTVVTLSGPDPMDTTGITGNELSLVYSYSADELYGRVLTGSIEVAAAIDGVAITPSIEVDEAQGRGEITVVLQRLEYPDAGGHELAVTLSLSAAAEGFVLGEPSSITTTFSFGALVVADADTVVTLSGPDPMDTTGITGNELSLVYSYSADELYGRVLTGSIEVAAAIDGVAITPSIEVDEAQGRGEITVVLQRQTYPDSGEHELAVTLSLSATAAGFVLGEPSSITTTFSFGALVVADADTVVTLSGPDPMDTTGITGNELSLVYSYSADELYGRVLTGSIEVAAAIDGVAITPSIEVDEAQGRGEITVVLQRQTYPDSGEHELAVTLSLSATAAGFVLGEPSSITTTFSFGALVVADADTVVTLSGPDPMDTTGITGNELSLVYSYSADDLRGRVLTGSIEVAAAIDGVAITPSIEVDEAQGRGEITVVLQRQTYPDAGEHELAVTLSLSATAEGFVLGEPSSITTTFSFGALVVADADTVVTLSGPDPMDTTGITGNELSLVYSYSADDLRGRALTGSIEVAAAIDGVAITPSIEVDEDEGRGEITVVLQRLEYPGAGGHELAVTLSLSAAAEGFVLGEPSSITTTFSFGALVVADADTVVTLSGPDPMDTTGITGNELSLVYSYSADDLRGRTLMGNVDVVASVDAVAITPAVNYVDEARGEITIILSRAEYPEPDEHELAVTLSLSATAEGFVLGEPSSITTTFSFGALVVADADTVVTLSGPDPMDTTGITGNELSLVYSYSADDLRGRALTGSIEVAAAIDGVAITPSIEVDEDEGRGEITVVLQRLEYPDAGGHELAVTLSLSATAAGFVLGEPSSITTTFSFGALVVADADTVVTLSGPVHDLLPADATAIAGYELSLVYSYSADELRGRALTGSIEVAAAIDGVAITTSIEVDEARGRGKITVVLLRREYPDPGEHELAVTLSLSAAATGFVLGETSSISTTFGFSLISTAIAEDGTCQIGILGPGEKCLYRGSSYYLRVLEAASGPQVFFFGPNEVGEPLNLEDALNPHDSSDFKVYNLEVIKEGRGYRIIRVYSAPEYPDGKLSGSMDGATILLAVLFFFANLALGLAGGPRRRLWR